MMQEKAEAEGSVRGARVVSIAPVVVPATRWDARKSQCVCKEELGVSSLSQDLPIRGRGGVVWWWWR